MKQAILIAMLSIPMAAIAGPRTTHVSEVHVDYGSVMASVQLNADASARFTDYINVKGRTQQTLYVDYDRGASGTATHVTVICWAGRSRGTMAKIPILYESSTQGTRDAIQHVWRFAVTATETLRVMIAPLNDALVRCQVGSEGALDNDDTASAYTRTGVI